MFSIIVSPKFHQSLCPYKELEFKIYNKTDLNFKGVLYLVQVLSVLLPTLAIT